MINYALKLYCKAFVYLVVIPVAVVLFLIAVANDASANSVQRIQAPVITSIPVYQTYTRNIPIQECTTVYVEDNSNTQSNTIQRMIIGGLLGSAVGNQVSDSHGSGTAGAVIGSIIANEAGRNESTTIQPRDVCNTVYETVTEDRIVGYEVIYEFNEQRFTAILDRQPGQYVTVEISQRVR